MQAVRSLPGVLPDRVGLFGHSPRQRFNPGYIMGPKGRERASDPPSLTGERTRVSKQGTQYIRWRGIGRNSCFWADGRFYGVSRALPQLRIGAPVSLNIRGVQGVLPTVFGFDVSADGSRFLVSTVREPRGPNLVVVKDWESLIRHPAP